MTNPEKKLELVHIFDEISTLTEEDRCSTTVHHFNVPWDIRINQTDRNLNVFLRCGRPRQEGNWSIRTSVDLKIVSVNGKCEKTSMEPTYGSASGSTMYGRRPILTISELMREFVVDDKLIVEAHVTIEEMTGIEKPRKLRNFDETAKEVSDIIINIGDEKFYVLKEFLVLQSTFFKSFLAEKPDEAEKSEITLEDVDPQTFQIFLEMLYLEPSLTDCNVEDVLQLTDKFKSKNGARFCEMFLICESKHCLRTKLRLAGIYKFEKLKKCCFNRMKCAADVRSVVGPDDSSEVDSYISGELLKKLLSISF